MKKFQVFSLVFAVLIVLSLALAACGGGAATEAPKGDAAAGQAAWATLACKSCHGDSAEGNIGPKLTGYAGDYATFTDVIRNGKNQMPAWGADKLTDQQMLDLYAWFTQ